MHDVHTNPTGKPSELFENVLQTAGIGKHRAPVRLSVDKNHLKTLRFSKKDHRHNNHVISLTEFSSNTNPK